MTHTARKTTKVKMVTQSPTDRNQVTWLPSAVAWAAARGIATGTHYAVVLIGEFGTARFNQDGSGVVEWNEKSTKPVSVTPFDARTTVAI